MKKAVTIVMVFLSVLALTALTESTPPVGGRVRADVPISGGFEPYMDRFTKLMEDNDITIDWSKISSINVVPLQNGIQGLYNTKTLVILIQPYQYRTLTKQAYDNILFAILAHEIGHSQGFEHTLESGKLMSVDDIGIYEIINNDKLIEKLILEAYIK